MTATLQKPNPEPSRMPLVVQQRIQYLQGLRSPEAQAYARALQSEWR
jgi:hypothetical protein